jgi:hypothetical protein
MEDTNEKNGVQHWQPSTAVADDLEALYAQAEIEKLAENKHPRKRKHGVLDTVVGLPPVIAEAQQSTNPRIRRSCRIAEPATEPAASTMALFEPRPGPRSRDSACAHNETDVAVMGGSETLASRRSKREVNASRAASLDESGQTADGSGNTNEEQNSGTPFIHLSMPQKDGPTPIGFSPFGGIPVFGGSRAPVATVDLEPSESHNALASSALVDHISPSPFPTASVPATLPPITRSLTTSECVNCRRGTSSGWYRSKLQIGIICKTCYNYEERLQRPRPLELEMRRRKRKSRIAFGPCANCHRSTSSRSSIFETGQDVCEPCYRYEIAHQQRRPLELEGKRKKRRILR